ncbi:MAG TPA: hypothetical protein ENI52_04625 [Thermoplasmata archaeon]|nr:hypothetical protein [Thermoplasmata archaeon]
MRQKYLILYLLKQLGGTIEGETKLQKLVFLGKEEFELPFSFSYSWENFGPFSGELRDILSNLENEGLIKIEEKKRLSPLGDPFSIRVYKLTKKGSKYLLEHIAEINKNTKKHIEELIDIYGKQDLKNILNYVYKTYSPEEVH